MKLQQLRFHQSDMHQAPRQDYRAPGTSLDYTHKVFSRRLQLYPLIIVQPKYCSYLQQLMKARTQRAEGHTASTAAPVIHQEVVENTLHFCSEASKKVKL